MHSKPVHLAENLSTSLSAVVSCILRMIFFSFFLFFLQHGGPVRLRTDWNQESSPPFRNLSLVFVLLN